MLYTHGLSTILSIKFDSSVNLGGFKSHGGVVYNLVDSIVVNLGASKVVRQSLFNDGAVEALEIEIKVNLGAIVKGID